MDELRPDGLGPVGKLDLDGEHLGDEVSVGEPPGPEGARPPRLDPDPDGPDVRLEPHGVLDRPGEPRRGPFADGRAEVLVEDAAELDPGLEQERLPRRQRDPVELGRAVAHGPPPATALELRGGTVNGPTK